MYYRYLIGTDDNPRVVSSFSSAYMGPINPGDVHQISTELFRINRVVYDLQMNTVHLFVENLDVEKRSPAANTQGRDNKGSRK